MCLNIGLRSLCDFQERLTFGREPDAVTDMIPEGEVILTINVYYPAIIDKVSLGSRSPSNLTISSGHFFILTVILHTADVALPPPPPPP